MLERRKGWHCDSEPPAPYQHSGVGSLLYRDVGVMAKKELRKGDRRTATLGVLVKEVVLQLIDVPNPLVCGQRKASFGLLVKPHDDTHQRVRWVDDPTHRAPAQLLAWYVVANVC